MTKLSKEEITKLNDQYTEAKNHFLYYYKPEFDRAYKLFASYTGDRAKELEKMNDGRIWQSNVFIPQIFSYIKIFLQKAVGVSPDFKIKGEHSEPLKEVIQWLWEIGMEEDLIDYFLQAFITGNTVGKDFLKKDKIKKREKQITFVDQIKKLLRISKDAGYTYRPDFDPVDIYNFYTHPRAKKLSDPFRKFQRYVITIDEAKKQYPDVPESVWAQFNDKKGGEVQDYAAVREEVLLQVYQSIKETTQGSSPFSSQGGQNKPETKEDLFEFVESWTDDEFIVFSPTGGETIIVKEGDNPHDHGESPYRLTKFFPRPFQLLGMGIPKLVEHLQELLNSQTNQRSDAISLAIHGMIAAAPSTLPGYKSSTFKFGPMQILWTPDPKSINHIKLGGVDQSSFVDTDNIKDSMRTTIGIDEYSTLKGTDRKETATVASFMREATLEGVKLFLIMLKNSYTGHFEHFIRMIKQYWTKRSVVPKKALAILDDYTDVDFPVLEENWTGVDGKHLLFPDEYEISIEQASTLATSTELAKTKDLEFWNLVKDAPDDMLDPETGKIFSIKKFKIMQKIIEDYGWEKDNYIVERKIPIMQPAADPNNPAAQPSVIPSENNNIPLPGNAAGADLGAAL